MSAYRKLIAAKLSVLLCFGSLTSCAPSGDEGERFGAGNGAVTVPTLEFSLLDFYRNNCTAGDTACQADVDLLELFFQSDAHNKFGAGTSLSFDLGKQIEAAIRSIKRLVTKGALQATVELLKDKLLGNANQQTTVSLWTGANGVAMATQRLPAARQAVIAKQADVALRSGKPEDAEALIRTTTSELGIVYDVKPMETLRQNMTEFNTQLASIFDEVLAAGSTNDVAGALVGTGFNQAERAGLVGRLLVGAVGVLIIVVAIGTLIGVIGDDLSNPEAVQATRVMGEIPTECNGSGLGFLGTMALSQARSQGWGEIVLNDGSVLIVINASDRAIGDQNPCDAWCVTSDADLGNPNSTSYQQCQQFSGMSASDRENYVRSTAGQPWFHVHGLAPTAVAQQPFPTPPTGDPIGVGGYLAGILGGVQIAASDLFARMHTGFATRAQNGRWTPEINANEHSCIGLLGDLFTSIEGANYRDFVRQEQGWSWISGHPLLSLRNMLVDATGQVDFYTVVTCVETRPDGVTDYYIGSDVLGDDGSADGPYALRAGARNAVAFLHLTPGGAQNMGNVEVTSSHLLKWVRPDGTTADVPAGTVAQAVVDSAVSAVGSIGQDGTIGQLAAFKTIQHALVENGSDAFTITLKRPDTQAPLSFTVAPR